MTLDRAPHSKVEWRKASGTRLASGTALAVAPHDAQRDRAAVTPLPGRALLGVAATLGLWGGPSAAFAEPVTEVVVPGGPLPASDQSASGVVLRRAELDAEPSGRVENALGDVPGVQQYRRSDARLAHPTSQGLTLRGLGGNASSRALVLLDGVPQADPFGGWISWPAFDALPLKRIRIQPGGGTGADGPGALAGTVELVTASPHEPRVESGSFAGSRGSFAGRFSLSGPVGPVASLVAANYEHGQGSVPIAPEQRGSVDRPAAYGQAGGGLRLIVPMGRDAELESTARGFHDARERGVPFSENENQGADVSARLRWRSRRGLSGSALTYLQRRQLRSSFASVADDRSSAFQVLDQYHVPSVGAGTRLEISKQFQQRLALRVGADWRMTAGRTEERYLFTDGAAERERRAGGRSDTLGMFQEGMLRLSETVVLSGGGRADLWSLRQGFRTERELGGATLSDEPAPDRSGVEGTGRVGLAWLPAEGWRLRSAGYTGWRLPTLNELHRPFRVGADATAANPALEPERLWGAEAGFDFSAPEGIVVSTTAFVQLLRDAVANVTLAEGPGTFDGVGFVSAEGVYRQRRNLQAIRSLGGELRAELDGRRLLGVPGATLDLSYSHVNAIVRSSGEAAYLDGGAPAQVPEDTLTTSLSWLLPDRAQLAATVHYAGAQFEDDERRRVLNDAWTLDGVASLHLFQGLFAVTRVENATDTRVEVSRSASGLLELGQPRTFWFGLRSRQALGGR